MSLLFGFLHRGVRATSVTLALAMTAVGQTTSPACDQTAISFTPDYQYVVGSAGGVVAPESGYRWLANGRVLAAGHTAEGLLLHFDGATTAAGGETPTLTVSVGYVAGRWGQALALPNTGRLTFPCAGNLDLTEGTLEFWTALRADGTNAAYATRDHVLFSYRAPGGDTMQVAQSSATGILYAGGTAKGQWESAYGGRGSMRAWRAGEWHHLAFTWSASGNAMRFFVDGALAAANNEGHYWPPQTNGTSFYLGGAASGSAAEYWLDEVRLSTRPATGEEILARAQRLDAPKPNEQWLAATHVAVGTSLVFEITPISAGQTGAVCQSTPVVFTGIPVTNPQPPSTLLAPGSTGVELTVDTVDATACAYSLGTPLPFAEMRAFSQGAGSRRHQTRIAGLTTDPNTVNHVYVRCAAQPDYLLHLRYRVLADVNPPYPRKGNLWGWGEWLGKGLPYMSKVDLWLGAGARPEEIRALRRLNPHTRLLTSINAVENDGLPPDYYLKDTKGNRIEVWPGSYRLNLTKPYVAEYQARFAAQTVLDADLMPDGVFFDNVMTTQSWQTHDIYGNPVSPDADEDGQPDDPKVFDAKWKAGVFHELETFRVLMPHAIVNGHAMDINEPGIGALFNGISFGFMTANVLEGEETFAQVWRRYQAWQEQARQPVSLMVESSPVDQIAYGYDYSPWEKIPASTLTFAHTFYPWVRFGLAFTLMGDGYFAHEYGDTWHGNDWWCEELDFSLGYPLGPARRAPQPGLSGTNLVVNPGFESALGEPWRLYAAAGCTARLSRDTSAPAQGSASARIEVTATTAQDWQIDFAQWNRSLVKDASYALAFRARAGAPRPISVSCQKGSPDWRNYGLYELVNLTAEWQEYTVHFEATETVKDARLQFFLGATTGTVWLDDVRLTREPPVVLRRDFTHGVVLLNGTKETQDVALEPGLRRLQGTQAPLVELILDDLEPAFTTTGSWTNFVYDSGEWKAAGPFYHAWAASLHQSLGANAQAQWNLLIEADDTYTLSAWWPAGPLAANLTSRAVYEIVADDAVLARVELDQTKTGDQWHELGTVRLAATNRASVRLTTPAGSCVADALLLRSAARYNNGQPAPSVRLRPLDGIILRRDQPVALPPRVQRVELSPNDVLVSLAGLTPGCTNLLQRTSSLPATVWETVTAFPALGWTANVAEPRSGDREVFYRVQVLQP